MIYKFHIAVLTLLLGFFLNPMQVVACGNKAEKIEKSCCKSNKKEKSKSCCCKDKSGKKDKKGCGGKCGGSCHCAASYHSFAFPFYFAIKIKNFPIISKQKLFSKNDNYFSSGFYSIWLPPKIC